MSKLVTSKDESKENMNEITADFACLKVSALGKAFRISNEINRITIGPDSEFDKEDTKKLENIENEQNCCNVDESSKPWNEQSKASKQNRIQFSMRKIMLEGELQRREKVQKEVERKWQLMERNESAMQRYIALSRSHMAEERERKNAQKYADILAEEERIAEQEETRRRHEQQSHARRAHEQKEKLKQGVEECKKKRMEKEIPIINLVDLKRDLIATYYSLLLLTQSCKDINSMAKFYGVSTYILNQLNEKMNILDKRIKNHEVATSDFSIAELVCQAEEFLIIFKKEIDKINTLCDENATVEQTVVIQEHPIDLTVQEVPKPNEEEKCCDMKVPQEQIDTETYTKENNESNATEVIATEVIATEEITTEEIATEEIATEEIATEVIATEVKVSMPEKIVSPEETSESSLSTNHKEADLYKYVDKHSLQFYTNSQEFLENYLKAYKEFSQSSNTKQFRFDCQKAINIPVNAISGINQQHLRDKYERLCNLLNGNSFPNVGQYPQGALYCMNMLAKIIVSQGETLVSSKPKMAFPIAAIIVSLWNEHADFGILLLSYFHKTCPFTVPVFLPQIEGQSDEDYYKSLGYKYSKDGNIEKQDKFLKRMSGVMRLYASITVTSQRKGVEKKHPHGLENAWRWLAAMLNNEPLANTSDLSATLILDVLEVTGNALWNAYPKQFRKLLILLANEYYPRMEKSSGLGGGPLTRLEEFLRNTLTKSTIPLPDGYLPPNFW